MMLRTSPIFFLAGILGAALLVGAFGVGCTKPASAATPPVRRVLVMSETVITGCVPVDEPGRKVFCDDEVGMVVEADDALAQAEHAVVLDGTNPPIAAE